MSTEREDGGPAFPTEDFVPTFGGGGHRTRTGGMTLRQWYAGQALAGAAVATDTIMAITKSGENPATVIAERACAIADAVIAALKAEGTQS